MSRFVWLHDMDGGDVVVDKHSVIYGRQCSINGRLLSRLYLDEGTIVEVGEQLVDVVARLEGFLRVEADCREESSVADDSYAALNAANNELAIKLAEAGVELYDANKSLDDSKMEIVALKARQEKLLDKIKELTQRLEKVAVTNWSTNTGLYDYSRWRLGYPREG